MRQKSKFAVCAAFKNGFHMLSFILDNNYQVEFVATSDRDDSQYEGKIAALCEKHGVAVVRGINANSEAFIGKVRENDIDLVFLTWWPSIIKKEAIDSARKGWVNIHPSMLPYNRGKHPYYWSIIDGTPFGVTIHFIDPGTDTGEILFQEEISVEITDTGESLYQKADDLCLKLFKEKFPLIVNGDYRARKQDDSIATMHYAKDIASHSHIDLEQSYTAKDLINIIRGRTFFAGDSAFFYHDGEKYHIRVSIDKA